MRRSAGACVAAGVTIVGAASPGALAQDQQRRIESAIRQAGPSERLKTDTSLSLQERTSIDVGGFVSFTFLNLQDSDANSRLLLQPEVTLYGRAVIDGAHTFFGRARFQYRDFSPGDSFDGRGDRWTEPFVDRWWYEFDLRQAAAAYQGKQIEGNINVRAGRQFVDWGAGLALSENLYAVRPTFEWGAVRFEGLAGITPGDESVVDFDASREDYDQDTKRAYYGGKLVFQTSGGTEFYSYVLNEQDHNPASQPTVNLNVPVDFDYNATYLAFGANGSFTPSLVYLAEFVYEFGTSQSDPLRGPQTTEDIGAWAARGQLTYVFRDVGRSRLELETLFASGDSDRLVSTDTVGGNLSGTVDTGFNSLGFANTGLAFAPSLSNLLALRFGGSTYPFVSTEGFEQFQIGLDLMAFGKMEPDGPIDEPTSDDRYLGCETDLYANYRVTSDLALTLRYGVFFPGTAISGDSQIRQFILLGVTLSF